jgi:hypothetical protein
VQGSEALPGGRGAENVAESYRIALNDAESQIDHSILPVQHECIALRLREDRHGAFCVLAGGEREALRVRAEAAADVGE